MVIIAAVIKNTNVIIRYIHRLHIIEEDIIAATERKEYEKD
jgi:hypothetical protein